MTREEAIIKLIGIKALLEESLSMCGFGISDVFDIAIKALEQQKTGHWIRGYKDISYTDYTEHIPQCKCSECGSVEDSYISQFIKYCPNCGAKMVESE